jgi:hypothetical protein
MPQCKLSISLYGIDLHKLSRLPACADVWPGLRQRRVLAGSLRLALQAAFAGPVAQGIEQQPSKLKVAGSNPAGVANT